MMTMVVVTDFSSGKITLEEQSEAGSAVDRRAFVNFRRNTLHEAVVDEYGQRSAEAPVQEAKSPSAVGQIQVLGRLQHGEHDRLERDQHRHNTHEVQDAAPSGFVRASL